MFRVNDDFVAAKPVTANRTLNTHSVNRPSLKQVRAAAFHGGDSNCSRHVRAGVKESPSANSLREEQGSAGAHNAGLRGALPRPATIYRTTGTSVEGDEQRSSRSAHHQRKLTLCDLRSGGINRSYASDAVASNRATSIKPSSVSNPPLKATPLKGPIPVIKAPGLSRKSSRNGHTFHPRCRGSKELGGSLSVPSQAIGGHIASAVNPGSPRVHGNMPLVRRDSYFLHPSPFFLGQRHLATDGQSQDGWSLTFIPHQNSPTVSNRTSDTVWLGTSTALL